jgi:hypothetical protein
MGTTRRLGAFSGRNDAMPGLGERWFCLRGPGGGGAGIITICYERRIPKVLCLQVTVEINISLLKLMPRSRAVVHVLPRASAARGCYSPRLHRCRENIDPHVKSTPETVRRAREPTGMSTSKTPSRRRVLGVLLTMGTMAWRLMLPLNDGPFLPRSPFGCVDTHTARVSAGRDMIAFVR